MSSLQTFLFIVQIVLSVLIILCVLLQQTDGDSLSGIGGGNGNAQMLSKRSTSTPMSKFTMTLFVLFMLNSMLLATFSARGFDKNDNITIENILNTKNK
ncbi:MAG: preprotein translocase subunit SecG [Rickettsiales bacterium]|nr:preprotein translocase subunit SecG [Rickettsiales bacterium]